MMQAAGLEWREIQHCCKSRRSGVGDAKFEPAFVAQLLPA
jgi:hypothetical protein